MVGDADFMMRKDDLRAGLDYLRAHPEIRDVLLTGGDPLVFSDPNLDWLLGELREIPHVEVVRLGSRLPVVNPMRVTPELCSVLRRHHPVWLNTHFNHPRELTPEARRACERLADAGVPVGNQTVLLAGVNDDADTMRALCEGLVTMRVRPYYLYQAQLLSAGRPTSGRPLRRAWRSCASCAATRPGSPCRRTSSTRPTGRSR